MCIRDRYDPDLAPWPVPLEVSTSRVPRALQGAEAPVAQVKPMVTKITCPVSAPDDHDMATARR